MSENPFLKIKDQVTEYVSLQIEAARLTAYEKVARISAALSSVIILLFLVFFALLFIFLAAAFYLGELLHSNAAGFGLVALLYLLIITVFLLTRKKSFEKKIADQVVSILTDDKDEKAE